MTLWSNSYFTFFFSTGIFSRCSTSRAAATGFLQSCVFLNLFSTEPKTEWWTSLPSEETLQRKMGCLCTYLRTWKWGAPLGFPEASAPRGWNANAVDLAGLAPSQLITSLSALHFPFPFFIILAAAFLLSLPPQLSLSLSRFLSPREARQCQTAFLHSCGAEEAGDHQSDQSWGLICRGVKFAWTKAAFSARNSCLWGAPSPHIVMGLRGEDVRQCPAEWINRIWKLGRRGRLAWWCVHGGTQKTQPPKECPSGLSKMLRFVKTVSGTFIWCQPGGRNKIYSYQDGVFSSLAIGPWTTPSPKCFPQSVRSSHFTVTCYKFQREKLLSDKTQQLRGDSWVDMAVGITLGPERKLQQVGVDE